MSKKLLLADDSITIQKVIGITFANEDYDLEIVDNGDAALEKARASRPDLILADVFMPGKNGYELCAAVKQDPALRGVPVLLLTGTFEPFDEEKAQKAGADSWIAKPFESQALIDRVEELLAHAPAPLVAPEAAQPRPAAPGEAPGEAEIETDLWKDLEETGEGFRPEAFEGPEVPAEMPAEWEEPASVTAGETGEPGEEDIWGAISFAEEDLLGGSSAEPEEGELWGPAEKEFPAGEEVTTEEGKEVPFEFGEADESFLIGEEEDIPFGEESSEWGFDSEEPAAEALGEEPPGEVPEEHAALAEEVETAGAGWEEPEDEIIPLDESDILEEEDLEALSEDLGTAFGLEEEAPEGPAPPSTGQGDEFAEEEPTAPAGEFPLTEEGPEWGIAEEPAARTEPFETAGEPTAAAPPVEAFPPSEPPVPPAPVFPAASAGEVEEMAGGLSEEQLTRIVENVAGAIIEKLAGSVLEKIAWEVVPDLAENMIREEIRKIKEGAGTRK